MSKRKYNNRRESVITDFIVNFAMIAGFLAILVALIIFLHKDQFDFFGDSGKEKGSNHYEIELDTEDDTSSSSSTENPIDDHTGSDRPSNLDIPEGAYFAIDTVNIRSEASTSSQKHGKLQKYDYVVVDSIENGWAKIVYEDSESGFAYVSDDYLSNDEDFVKEAKAYLTEAADEEAFLSDSIVDKTSDTYTSEALLEDLNELQAAYPDSLTVETVATSDEGKDIYQVILGNKDASEDILVYGNTSGAANMTEFLMACQIEYYLESLDYWYDKDAEITYRDILDSVAIHFMPYVNPDGTDALSEATITALRDKGSVSLQCAIRYDAGGETVSWNTEDIQAFDDQYNNVSTLLIDATAYKNEHNEEFPQWFIKEVPVFTISVGDKNPLPVSDFYDIWKDNKDTLIAVANYYME